MFVRQVKRKCSVRGCKSTDCFAISRTREVGNTVIICKSCLGKALGAIDEIDPKTKSNIPAADNTTVPSLFFNAKALGKTDVKDGLTADVVTVDENPTLTPENTQGENGNADADDKEPDNGSNVPPVDDGNKEPEQTDGTVPPADGTPDADGVTPPTDGVTPDADGVTPPTDGVTPDAEDVPPVTDAEDGTGDVTPPADVTEFKCPICGKPFDSEKGLKTHLRYCKPQTNNE